MKPPSTPPITDKELKALLKQLRSKDEYERGYAERALKAQGPSAFPSLLHLIRRERRITLITRWFLLVITSLYLFWAYYDLVYLHKPMSAVVIGWFKSSAFLFWGFLGNSLSTKAVKSATRILAERNDLCVLPILIEARQYINLNKIADTALIRLLPRLQVSDGSLLSDKHWDILYSVLRGKSKWSVNSDAVGLAPAILQAIAQTGNTQALPIVRSLAEGRGGWKEPAVRQAAQECLLQLQDRVEQERAMSTLLRAAEAPATSSDTLLRPANSYSAEAPQQLLRASTEEV
jgi:hypothetical protein